MARNLHARYRITGILTATTPIHVGGYGDSPDTDMPLARNGAGALYVPGTSLAGVLRAWCQQAFGEDATELLWGFQRRPSDVTPMLQHERAAELLWGLQPRDLTGQSSFILLEDAPVPKDTPLEIRDGVGLDRVWGTAASGIKYDRAILPSGTILPLEMTVEIAGRYTTTETSRCETPEAFTARVQRTEAILGHLLRALQHGDIPLGAASTRGLGRVTCTIERVLRQQLDSREGILAVLQGQGMTVSSKVLGKAAPATRPKPQPRLTLSIVWRPRGPLMVQAGYNGVGVDILPLVSATAQGVSLVLPGSSIKGALRSQAERIVRTVRGHQAWAQSEGRQRFLKQMEELPLIRALFGSRTQAQNERPESRQGPLPGLGALAVEDCYACDTMPPQTWRDLAAAPAPAEQSYEQQELHKVLNTLQRFSVAHHVAIDRWTGGAADGMLFSVLAPANLAWHDMRLHLDLGRLQRTDHLPALMLLLLTVRDLLQHRLPLGFATNRGMGEVEVLACQFAGTNLEIIGLEGLADIEMTDASFQALDAGLRARLTQAWQEWMTSEG